MHILYPRGIIKKTEKKIDLNEGEGRVFWALGGDTDEARGIDSWLYTEEVDVRRVRDT